MALYNTSAESNNTIVTPEIEVTPFPIDALPECLQDLVIQGAKANCCPPDYIAIPALTVLGAAIGNSSILQVKQEWHFKANLYTCVVGRAGSAKSPGQKIATRPLTELQQQMAEDHKIKMEIYKADTMDRKNKPEEPNMTENYTTDTTVEALAFILEHNPRGIIVIHDEITAWVSGLNQYKGGKGSDRETYLSFWTGSNAKINRKGKPVILLDNPFVSVTGSIPPSILSTLVDERKTEDGFIHRILFSYPDPVDQFWTEEVIEESVLKQYKHLYNSLWGLPNDQTVIKLDKHAYKFWFDIYNQIQNEKSDPNFPENLRGPWSKMPSQFARIILIIHCIRSVTEEIDKRYVDIDTMTQAFLLLEYFKSHAKRVYAHLNEDGLDPKIQRVLRWRKRNGQNSVTARELQMARICKNTEEAQKLFQKMEERGFGMIKESQGRGPKSINFIFC